METSRETQRPAMGVSASRRLIRCVRSADALQVIAQGHSCCTLPAQPSPTRHIRPGSSPANDGPLHADAARKLLAILMGRRGLRAFLFFGYPVSA
jgi:hypothetical protein